MTQDLCTLTIAEAAPRIASGALSPVTLTEAFLAKIEATDGTIRSYIHIDQDKVRAAAAQADAEIKAGRYKGTLHGIPFAVKDNYFTAGIRTCGGSRLMLDTIPDRSATAIEKLEAAGAILLGKLNTWEYGTGNGAASFDLPYLPARNPWNTDHFTGGSSSGSGAAMAAGLAMFTLGSDTGGSVRLPAAGCGVQGLKPTLGRISRAGILPNCYSFDIPGPLAWTVEDCAIVLQALAGPDERDPMSAQHPVGDYMACLETGLRGLRVGYLADYGTDTALIDPAVKQALDAALTQLRELGAELVPVALPMPPSTYRSISGIINWSESYAIHEQDFTERGELMGKALHEKMLRGSRIRAVDYLAAQRQRRILTDQAEGVMQSVDVMVTPTTYVPAPDITDDTRVRAFTSHAGTHLFSLTGHPAMSVCMGFSPDGLPVALQIAGRYFDEASVLRVAHAYERSTPWRDRRPDPAGWAAPTNGFAHLVPDRTRLSAPTEPANALADGGRDMAASVPRAPKKTDEPQDLYGLTR